MGAELTSNFQTAIDQMHICRDTISTIEKKEVERKNLLNWAKIYFLLPSSWICSSSLETPDAERKLFP